MRLRNKKTGEIKAFDEVMREVYKWNNYNSLAELNAEWEDAPEEPKWYWYIDDAGVLQIDQVLSSEINMRKAIGNYFVTREEAEKTVEKLKAWKRLKEAGFEFGGWTHTPITESLTGYNLHIKAYTNKLADYMDDLHLLFGGEE